MTGHSGDGFPPTEPLKGLRQILLMEQGRVEAQQSKVQIEQGADTHCGNDGADAHLTAQPPADEYNDHFHGGAAKAYRPVRLTGQYDHERIARTGAQGAFHIHPGAQSQQLHADQQRGQSGREALKQRDPVQVQQDVDEYRAEPKGGAAMTDELVLSLQHVTAGYREGGVLGRKYFHEVLHDVSFDVHRGEILGLVGESGTGKSTLAKHFNAILLPESGTVLVEGMDTKDEDKIYDIRQTVGMVFQNPDNQIVATVVEEDVAFALENLGVPPEEMRRRVDDSMKMAGIYEYRERAPHNLSGGQKQRVAIAGVVAMRPDCLILDEATAMLDPRGREQVMQTIHHLNKNMGITVVSITHYMEEAAQADRVLVMSKGHVVMEGTPKEVFSQTEKVRSLHLDVPQAAELRDELVKAGIPMPEGIIDTGECAQALYELLQ